MSPRLVAGLWGAVLLAGLAVRWIGVGLPLDHRTQNAWREADYAQIARAMSRGEGGLLDPRVDWRGDTSGEVEMELPLLPWLGGGLWRSFGGDERWLRGISGLAACLALLVFAGLARAMLPARAAWVAVAIMALNPIAISLATSLQPESLLLLGCVAAMAALWRFTQSGRDADLLLAAGMLAVAVLAKATAVHLAPVFAYAVLRREGATALRRPVILGAALLAALPPLAWMLWTHGHYLATGLSLGVSNESHWLGLEMLGRPGVWLRGLVRAEGVYVFGWAGLPLLLAAAWARRSAVELAAVWLASAMGFLLLCANTAGDGWAWYYHLIAVAPASLLLGAGADALASRGRFWAVVAGVLVVATLLVHTSTTRGLLWARFERPLFRAEVSCTRSLAPRVPEDALLLVRGGPSHDEWGQPVAYDRSMTFWWMDRKGFVHPQDGLDAAVLRSYQERGARFWWVTDGELDRHAWLERSGLVLREVGRCERWRLLELAPAGPPS